MTLRIEIISEGKPICLWPKPCYIGQSDRNRWNSYRFSFPPMLQIQRNFHKIMHDSKFGRDGSFLIVLKKHHVLFLRSVRHAVVQNRSSKSSRLPSCKVRDNSIHEISCCIFHLMVVQKTFLGIPL